MLAAFPAGVERPDGTVQAIARDGQVRVWWEGTPLDLFFDYARIHADAAAHSRTVPFAGTTIPVLGPVELTVFKAMFDRTRDWADIEAMVAVGTVDLDAARAALHVMLARDDERFRRLAEAERRADPATRDR